MKTRLALLFACLIALALPLSLHAAIVERQIRYTHAGAQLTGLLVYDDAQVGGRVATTAVRAVSPRPGVLVIHQWMGRGDFERVQARRLAEAGFVAFALDMYGQRAQNAQQAGALAGQFYGKPLMAERARAGLDQLLASGLVDKGKVAAVGYCFGGTTAMALAYSGAPLAGIVSFHGGLIPPPDGADFGATTEAGPRASGEDQDAVSRRRASVNGRSTAPKFLLCHGAADPLVPWEKVVEVVAALERAQIDYQLIAYQGAVHSFTDPSATGENPAAKYHAAAAERSWGHMLQFFSEIF